MKWILPPAEPERAELLARELGVHRLVARSLLRRGLADMPAARRFLEPSLLDLRDPGADPTCAGAAERIWRAVCEGQQITIYGDYDADGICATALLVNSLRTIGARVDYYIPDRCTEGYGLSCESLSEIRERGADLAVTVDCGISAVDEARHAAEIGLDLIITDHHEPGETGPEAPFVLNPMLEGCTLGYRRLAGVGIAFKLAWAIGQALSGGPTVPDDYRPLLVDALPLVAIGTVADMVPLLDENRVLTHFGLRALPQTKSPGLRALLEVAGVGGDEVSTYHVGYQIAPRLNAVGRMSDAARAVEMLTTEDCREAAELASYHDEQNLLRRNVQQTTCEEAMRLVEEQFDLDATACIVVASDEWHHGVVGLAASRLSERFSRPSFVLRTEEGVARGSARSVPGFQLFDAILECEDLLEQFGGHAGAAGVSLPVENLPAFTERINDVARRMMGAELPVPELEIDGEVGLDEMTPGVVDDLKRLAPFGNGNPTPLFMARNLRLVGQPQRVGGRRDHLSFIVRQGDTALRVIAFRKADWLGPMLERRGEPFALAAEPSINTFSGTPRLELRAEDLQWPDTEHIEVRAGAPAEA